MPWDLIDQMGDSPFMPNGREQPGSDESVPIPLSAEEREAIAASKAAAARGEFATDEQVRTTWAKHGL
jgi:hypothetical protein